MGRKLKALASGIVLAVGLVLMLPSLAWAAGSAYTESTDGDTTTYTFTTFHNVNAGDSSNDQTFRVDADGDVVLDFTHVPQSEVTGAEFILDLTEDNLTVTVKGDPAVDYGNSAITINSEPYAQKRPVTLELVDFQTDGIVTNSTNDKDHPFKVSFDGACRVFTIMADYLTLSAADDAASLSFVSSLIDDGALTMDGGTYQMGYHYISYPQVTIENANLVFSKTSGAVNEYQSIEAQTLTIEGSTIQGIASIYSVKAYGNAYQQTFADSSITIKNSVITYGDEVNASSYTGMLCNSKTITIEGSTITGAAAVWDAACIGGIFETLTIRDSEVYIESEVTEIISRTSPAIGPDDDAYTNYMDKLNITESSITIENSTVQAASRHSAAIGLPYLNASDDTDNLPQLSITIKGSSDITATSVYSPAIGGSSKAANIQDDGLVAAEIVVDNPGSIGAWEQVDGGNSAGELSLAAAPAGSADRVTYGAGSDVSLMNVDANRVLGDIETARNLLDNCSITIASTDSGTPTISAKSGVLAVYGKQVTVTGTSLVQATMVRITGSTWSVYPMETPGDVTIGTDTIGQLGYGYASVAGTGITAQSSVSMTFGDSSLKNVLDDSTTFATSGSGFEAFYVTPQALPLSGTVTLTGGNNGTAAVGDTLTADLTGLSPVRAKDKTSTSYDHLSFQWYRDGAAISGATGTTYKLVEGDSSAIITCVVSVKDGDTMFTGSVTSSAVLVTGGTPLAAPELASRTMESITLNAVSGCEYSIDYGKTWQSGTTFTGLEKGTAYTFILKDSDGNLSTAATFYTLSDTPDSGDFTIDYEAERLTFPEGVLLYSDKDCQNCLNQYSPRTWISISDYTGKTLYARYSTVDASDTDSVTEIEIPARPTVSEVTATVTGDTISFTGASGVAYRLTLDDAQVGEVKTGDGANSIEFTGLQPGTEYVLTMRKEASNETPNFRSAQINQPIRTKGSYEKDSTLLAKAGESSRSYDLTDLLGGLDIESVTATTGSFVTNAAQDTTNSIKLTFSGSQAAGDETTVTVTAKDDDSTLTLTLTVKAVEVMVVNETASVFWVKEEAHPGYVGMTDSGLKSAWTTGLKTADLTNHTNENTFALVPRYVVGGGTATKETATPEITWQVTGAADAANTDFTVLYIDSNKTATQITPAEKQDDTLTFNARSQTALYLVAWKERQGVTITVDLKNGVNYKNDFLFGDTLTAQIRVSKASTSSLPAPSGTVTLWLGEPNADGSKELGEETLSSGSADIQYTLGDDTPYSNDTQTLYIVYSGDENYSTETKTETVTFKAAAPDNPELTAEPTLDSVKLTWETPATHGSAITGYELAVKQNGNAISGSPFTIGADATEHTVSNLESGKEYSFTLTVKSAAGNAESTSVSVTTLSQSSVTILLPSGAVGSRSYYLHQWLGSGSNATVTVGEDLNNIVNSESTAYSGSALTLNYNAATAGQTATLEIRNGSKLLTVTVEVVDVVKEHAPSGTFVVKGEANPALVSMNQEDLTAAWNTKLNALGMENAKTDAFSLIPRYIVGGQTASIFATVDWAPDDEIVLADYRFVVLEMNTYETVREIDPTVSDNQITFNTSSSAPLYLVAWKALETPTIDVTFDGSEFELGSTITAHVTVSGGSGTPSGTVIAYLGDPASGSQIGQGNLSGGTAAIELSTSDMTTGKLTLTFVYEANGNYKSASATETITLVPAGTIQSKTILLPVGSDIQRDYDLSALLDGAEIQTVAEGTDSGNILSSATNEGPTLKLTGSADAEGKTAAVTVTAEKTDGSTLTLNLTVEAVKVLGEQDGVFFVQEYANPSMVGMTDVQDMLNAWNDAKDANGFQNAEQHSFAIRPRNIIGGDAATNAAATTVTWTPSGSQISVAGGSFLVLHIGQGDTAAETITYTRTGDSLTFTADGTASLYCVVYKEATGGAVTVSAELQKNGTAASSFRHGDTLTAVVTITPDTTASGLNPGGTVSLYLGDPDDGGKLLASGQMSDGSGTITYTLNDASILSNAEQTLYIVYPGDNTYLSGQAIVKAYLQPASSGGSSLETIEIVETEGGMVEVDPLRAQIGADITITPQPNEGKEVDEVTVTDGDGSPVEVTDNGDGTWSFKMPAGGAVVTVTFRCDGRELCPSSGYPDVDQSMWYHDAVDFAVSSGLMTGYADSGLFGPADPLGREQAAEVLHRALGGGAQAPACGLSDVDQSAWYAPAVNWAYESGLVTGYDDGSGLFGVGDALTREQFAAIVARVAGADLSGADPSVLDGFSDRDGVAEWAVPAVSWAVQAGVLEGSPDGDGGAELRAGAEINRAEMAAMVMRAAGAGLFPTPA